MVFISFCSQRQFPPEMLTEPVFLPRGTWVVFSRTRFSLVETDVAGVSSLGGGWVGGWVVGGVRLWLWLWRPRRWWVSTAVRECVNGNFSNRNPGPICGVISYYHRNNCSVPEDPTNSVDLIMVRVGCAKQLESNHPISSSPPRTPHIYI